MSADKDKQASNEILETDIVFDCPHCQKSLAIDYRAAGLSIPCTDCKKTVEVPIPEGMDISDLDSSEDDLRIRAIHLRESLNESQSRIHLLEGMVGELRVEKHKFELEAENLRGKLGATEREIEVMSHSLGQIMSALNSLSRAVKTD